MKKTEQMKMEDEEVDQPKPPRQKRKRKVKEEEEDDKSRIVMLPKPVVRCIYTTRVAAAAAPMSNEPINLKLVDQFENEMSFTIKRSTPLGKILYMYYEHHNKEKGSAKMVYEGRYCHVFNTPDQMGMEDGDEISVMTHAVGG